jgi:site-specific recombinase XerD
MVQTFFERYLPLERNLSPNTVLSYRDAMLLFLHYAGETLGQDPDRLEIAQLDAGLVRGFLEWLRRTRRCKARTANQRLAALKAFLKYVASIAPEHLDRCRQIRDIPNKRVAYAEPRYLEPSEMEALFRSAEQARVSLRDRALLAVLYNTGGRVQEVVNLDVGDLVLEAPPRLQLRGKGRKERTCPLWAATVKVLRRWVAERPGARPPDPLFINNRGLRITRSGVSYVLRSLASRARLARGEQPVRVAPHVIRHTTAMHLLQSGVDLVVIAAWLGHADVSTTHGYVEVDLRMKQAAVAGAALPRPARRVRYPAPGLVARLKAIGRGQDYAEQESRST